MALSLRAYCRPTNGFYNLIRSAKCNTQKCCSTRVIACNFRHHQSLTLLQPSTRQLGLLSNRTIRHCSTRESKNDKPVQDEEVKKLGLFKRFKQMYRDYWYVLVPVHLATSAVWLGSFYYLAVSGLDIVTVLEAVGVSETLLAPLRDSKAGYVATAFALYKIATPLRYAVTLGGTTLAIKKLTALGWIKPVPSSARMKEIFQEKKDVFQEKRGQYQTQMKERQTHVMDEMRRYKNDIRNIKNRLKKM